ncbi:hypothetical protein PPERSA_07340 [Pseudocohnilembus persalinus]|uniref:CRC domain-containing protein n=1 Tax=Pseudocohnilembus persalinus TaxID=266149 RepID=A0A0V0QAC0_PSEPJ|nr:hypothetical protein PPERSA_07340 [Pseudocohnilembus persalinus]|eukprot:KRW99087.1 hypothetical protein PPERSA_07340 [Pseudocohnilembus persalinus]
MAQNLKNSLKDGNSPTVKNSSTTPSKKTSFDSTTVLNQQQQQQQQQQPQNKQGFKLSKNNSIKSSNLNGQQVNLKQNEKCEEKIEEECRISNKNQTLDSSESMGDEMKQCYFDEFSINYMQLYNNLLLSQQKQNSFYSINLNNSPQIELKKFLSGSVENMNLTSLQDSYGTQNTQRNNFKFDLLNTPLFVSKSQSLNFNPTFNNQFNFNNNDNSIKTFKNTDQNGAQSKNNNKKKQSQFQQQKLNLKRVKSEFSEENQENFQIPKLQQISSFSNQNGIQSQNNLKASGELKKAFENLQETMQQSQNNKQQNHQKCSHENHNFQQIQSENQNQNQQLTQQQNQQQNQQQTQYGVGGFPYEDKRKKVNKKTKVCNCKKTQCLKLYCDCFAVGELCGEQCKCSSCHNNNENMKIRSQTIEQILEKNPYAFNSKEDIQEKKEQNVRKGCNCRKSGCLKKYCQCYQDGVKCTEFCKCTECCNMDYQTNSNKNNNNNYQVNNGINKKVFIESESGGYESHNVNNNSNYSQENQTQMNNNQNIMQQFSQFNQGNGNFNNMFSLGNFQNTIGFNGVDKNMNGLLNLNNIQQPFQQQQQILNNQPNLYHMQSQSDESLEEQRLNNNNSSQPTSDSHNNINNKSVMGSQNQLQTSFSVEEKVKRKSSFQKIKTNKIICNNSNKFQELSASNSCNNIQQNESKSELDGEEKQIKEKEIKLQDQQQQQVNKGFINGGVELKNFQNIQNPQNIPNFQQQNHQNILNQVELLNLMNNIQNNSALNKSLNIFDLQQQQFFQNQIKNNVLINPQTEQKQ